MKNISQGDETAKYFKRWEELDHEDPIVYLELQKGPVNPCGKCKIEFLFYLKCK